MLLENLDTKHDSYDPTTWEKARALYEGGKRFKALINEFLPQNPQEPQEVYSARKKVASYRSYVGPIIDYYVSWLFSASPSVRSESIDEFYTDFQSDVGGDVDLVCFAKERMTEALRTQQAHWLLQRPQGIAESRAEFYEKGLDQVSLRPVDREEVYDFEMSETGFYEWVLLHTISMPRTSLNDLRKTVVEEWRLYDQTNVTIYRLVYEKGKRPKDKKTVVPATAPAPHGFKRVPLITLDVPEGLCVGQRTMDAQVEHFRISSALGWAIRRTCFAMPILFLEDDTDVDTMGAGYYLKLNTNEKFEWASPPHTPFDIIGKEVDSQRDEIYRVCHQMAQGLDNNADTVGRSADSKEMDTASTRVLLQAYAKFVSEALEETFEAVAEARDEAALRWSVEGFTGFDMVAAGQLIGNAQLAQDLNVPSKTFQREIKTKAALALLPEVDHAVKETIKQEIAKACEKLGEIDAAPPPPAQKPNANSPAN